METNQKLGKYTLVRHIATGGMAEIWLAEQEGPGGFSKQLVIKRILSHLARDQQFTSMFLDEARTVAQLSHPNIGQIFELGELEGSYFIAMEYIEGVDLAVMIELARQRGEQVPVGIGVKIVVDMLAALEFAHTFHDRDGKHLGLVHRDVTPHNVLVSNDGIVKLVDFGVAKAKANQSKTQTGAVKGKFAYMAPEQIESKDMDHRVDIFAAGILLYELLTGQRPFGDDLFAINAILTQATPDPRTHRPELPQTVVNIIHVALAKDRGQRYQSAQTMMHDLEDYMAASGTYVNQRDISNYVRTVQGLALMGTGRIDLGAGPRAKITEREKALVTAEQPRRPMPAPQDPTRRASSPQAPTPQGPTPQGASSADAPARPRTITAPSQGASEALGGEALDDEALAHDQPAKRVNLVLVFIALLVLGGVAMAGVGVVAVMATAKDRPKPEVLLHQQGRAITIDATRPAKIYYREQLVGPTPLKTTLKPGLYTLEARDAKARKIFKITVQDTSTPQVFTAQM